MKKNVFAVVFICIGLTGCQSPSHSPSSSKPSPSAQKTEIEVSPLRTPATEAPAADSFIEQSHERCRYENAYFFSDDYGNSICSRNYRSADRSNRDVILIFSFMTEPGKGESRRTKECTTLSSDLGEKSYICEFGKRYFYIAHYQRGNGNGSRIWLEEVPAAQLTKVLKINHEEYRLNLKKKTGSLELKPDNLKRNKEFLNLVN